MFKCLGTLLVCAVLVFALDGVASAQSQTSLPTSFFGTDTSLCDPTANPHCSGGNAWLAYWAPTSSSSAAARMATRTHIPKV
jgi:hypothetical protein